ncbi:DNA glycosylase [Thelephora ganbajun]|uniref:DNA glycosylase n=1 Tax=Thelephora ganbajun TaxID=370292 RepID=A0ACB6ZSJ3_THEGA|nr:DNA glycosylase [Thelephora ganbajun]
MPTEDTERDETSRLSFRDAISRFSLGSKSKYFSSDRIKPLPTLNEERGLTDRNPDEVKELYASRQPPFKKRNVSEVSGSSKPPNKKKKPSRPYAPPETYAHLSQLPHYLKDDLDVVFCGINPAVRSSTDGHHYAHPTNHFWKCLTLSGFTGFITAAEDYTLPEKYNLGLTNLIDRPSAEQSELSKEEMQDAAPGLITKIGTYKPVVVCFVGKIIWNHVETYLVRVSKQKGGRPRKHPFSYDLQPYRLVYSKDVSEEPTRETLFFVVPSTSARVVEYDLKAKVAMFTLLRSRLDEVKATKVDTTLMTPIYLPISLADSATHSHITTPSASA